jgi:endoglucanase
MKRLRLTALAVIAGLWLTPVLAQEPLIDNTFATDGEIWELVLTGGGEAQSQLTNGANCVDINSGGRDLFGVQLAKSGFALQEGAVYQLSFDAYASSARDLKLKVGQAASPFTEFWSQTQTLAAESTNFSHTFTMNNPSEANSKLTFFMGGVLEAPVTVCFDNITLAEGVVAVAVNLLENGDFATEESWVFDAGALDAAGQLTGGEYCASLGAAGDNPWDISLRQAGLNLAANKTYQLQFDAYGVAEAGATVTASVGVKIGQSVDPFAEYFFNDQLLTNEKTTYTYSLEMPVSDANAQLELFMGAQPAESLPVQLCFDNVLVQEVVTGLLEREIPYIMVDQFGYRPNDTKVAVLVDPQAGFNAEDSYEPSGTVEVRNADDDSVVFSGDLAVWNDGVTQRNSGDKGWWFDFSAVTEPGSYYLADPEKDARSYTFDIGEDVYKNVLKAALRMFYYNRANIAKVEPFADARWMDGETYMDEGQDTEARFVEDKDNAELARDLSGGWFDAGDPNKYVTFANGPVHLLLTAFEQNPQAFGDDLNIPESGNGLPDVLDEVVWELDWVKKMQNDDGGVIIKMGDIDYEGASPFSQDKGPRFYGPVCSSSTIAAASMFAHAALVLKEIDTLEDYAADLQARALRAYEWYEANPKRTDCDTGEIKAGDADDSVIQQEANRGVTAVYLFALTQEEAYKQAVEDTYKTAQPFNDGSEPRWGIYNPEEGDALLYYTRLANANPRVVKDILDTKLAQLEVSKDLYDFQENKDLYRAFMRDESYHWGSSYPRANYGNTNLDMLHYQLASNPDFQERAQGILHYFHGVNPFNMVYLSNMYDYGAEYSANEIYHGWFNDATPWDNALISERGPAPGYVPGGPNKFYSGQSTPPVGEPAQKAYRDWNSSAQASWEISEPAIYYQAAYIKLLANFVGE